MLEMMAAVAAADSGGRSTPCPAHGSSSPAGGRLEVSIDGLTLSPDPEDEDGQRRRNGLEEEEEDAAAAAGRAGPGLESGPAPGSGDGQAAAAEGQRLTQALVQEMEQRWGFGLSELYSLAFRFFKEKDGKAFHPTYEEKLKLVALQKQISVGPYSPDSCPEVGFFDVLGNDRRREWTALGSMNKENAMVEFIHLVNKCCNLFEPYVTSHKIEKEEQERKRREEEERRRREEEERERLRQEEERQQREEEEKRRREEGERRNLEEERFRMEQQK